MKQYLAFLYNYNARIFVSFLLLFLLTIDAFKLSLRKKRNTQQLLRITI